MMKKLALCFMVSSLAALSASANIDSMKLQLQRLDQNFTKIEEQILERNENISLNESVNSAKKILKNINAQMSAFENLQLKQIVRPVTVVQNEIIENPLTSKEALMLGLFATLTGFFSSIFALTVFKKKFWAREIKTVRITHDLVLKSLPQAVICLYKGRALYVNPAAEAAGLTKENFSEIIISSSQVEEGSRVITLNEEKFYLDEEIVDANNNIVLISTRPYRSERAPLENIIGLKDLEKSVATKSLLMEGSTNVKSEFLVSLEKSSYLFQIAGKIINLNITESSLVTCIEPEKINKVFTAYLDTLYRLIKDDEGDQVYINLNSDSKNLRLSSYIENGIQARQKIENGQGEVIRKMATIKGELYGFAPQINVHKFKDQNGFEFLLTFELTDNWEKFFEGQNSLSM